MIAGMLLSWHNLQYFQQIMSEMRAAIPAGRFAEWQTSFHRLRAAGDIEPV